MSTSETTPSNTTSTETIKPLTQQFFELAQARRAQARELRASVSTPDSDADKLDAEATKLEDRALDIAAQSEVKRESVKFEKWLKEQEHYLAWHLENARSIISMSQSAVRVIATANAGAAVALLAFIGNALAKDAHLVAEHFALPLFTFAIGVVLAVFVAGASYLTQLFYGDNAPKRQKLAIRLHWLSAILWFATTGAFAGGCFQTYFAVRSMTTNEDTPMAGKDTDRGSVEFLKENAPPPARPASEPPVVKMPAPTPPASNPGDKK